MIKQLRQWAMQGGTFTHNGNRRTFEEEREFEACECSRFSETAEIWQQSVQLEPRATARSVGEQSQPACE